MLILRLSVYLGRVWCPIEFKSQFQDEHGEIKCGLISLDQRNEGEKDRNILFYGAKKIYQSCWRLLRMMYTWPCVCVCLCHGDQLQNIFFLLEWCNFRIFLSPLLTFTPPVSPAFTEVAWRFQTHFTKWVWGGDWRLLGGRSAQLSEGVRHNCVNWGGGVRTSHPSTHHPLRLFEHRFSPSSFCFKFFLFSGTHSLRAIRRKGDIQNYDQYKFWHSPRIKIIHISGLEMDQFRRPGTGDFDNNDDCKPLIMCLH